MNAQSQPAVQQQDGHEPVLVVTQEHGRFRVYDPRNPNQMFDVQGTAEAPWCSCPEFQANQSTPGFRCPHITAVFPQSENGQAEPSQPSSGSRLPTDISPVQMTLKRSASPDGRIDSLSVEFTGEVYDAPDSQVMAEALRITNLQTAILNGFMAQHGPRSNASQASSAASNGEGPPTPAMLTTISGMQTKVGWRYFVNVQVGDRALKLFGTRDQLAEHLRAAGHGHAAGNIAKGVVLNLPCMAVTRPSDDGKYVNVERLMPYGAGSVPAQPGHPHGP